MDSGAAIRGPTSLLSSRCDLSLVAAQRLAHRRRLQRPRQRTGIGGVADLDDIATTLHLPPAELGANSVHLILKPGDAGSFEKALRADSRLRVDLLSESDFYAQSASFSDQIRKLGLVVAWILSIGAIFGAMNTMYSAVARRKREVGTLRVLGFGRGNVLAAFILESIILALAGGVVGELLAIAIAYATGLQSRLMNVGTVLFSFQLPWSVAPV